MALSLLKTYYFLVDLSKKISEEKKFRLPVAIEMT